MITLDRLLEIALSNAGSAVVLALLAGLAQLWLRRPAIVRGLWLLVLVKLMTPPIYELGIPLARVPEPLPQTIPVGSASPALTMNAVPDPSSVPAITNQTMALVLWLLGSLAMTALTMIRTVRFQKTLARAKPAAPTLQDRVDNIAIDMGIGRPPRAVLVESAISPMLWAAPGSCRLIVPQGLLQQLSTREIDTLIAHELAHLRRRDHWVRYLELLAMVLFWWHPAAWWASRQLRRAEEECCDFLVARTLPGHRRAYADCLLKTMKYLAQAGRAPYALDSGALATGAGEVQDLQRRLTMIMKRTSPNALSTPSRVVLTALAFALLAVFPTIADGGAGARGAAVTQVNPRFTGDPMDFDPRGAPLGDVLRQLTAKTGLNIVIDPSVDLSSPVTTRFKGIPWDQILSVVINNQALSYSVEGKVVWIAGANAVGKNFNFQGEPISVNLDNADLRGTLRHLADQAQLQIEIAPGIEGKVNLHLEDVPWDQVVDTILRINGLHYVVEDSLVKVLPTATE